MKLSRRSELGRSLIEMIAVLVVIAILTIGSLGGYSFLVRKWRENQAIDQVNSLIVGMRAGNLSQRFAAGESIPVQTIVRGLKTDADGAAILPDGDNSWAKVTSFGVNNYMIALESGYVF